MNIKWSICAAFGKSQAVLTEETLAERSGQYIELSSKGKSSYGDISFLIFLDDKFMCLSNNIYGRKIMQTKETKIAEMYLPGQCQQEWVLLVKITRRNMAWFFLFNLFPLHLTI